MLDDDDNEQSPNELEIKFTKGEYDNTLFAEPTYREWETLEHPYEDWEILLQVDFMDGDDFHLNFMDCGVLDFLISPKNLKVAKFNNMRGIVLST